MLRLQSLTAVTDSKTRELYGLLQEDRSHSDRGTHSQQIAYRTQAEAILGSDDNLYRVEFAPADEQENSAQEALLGYMRFQLVGKDVIGPEDLGAAEREWAEYVANYVRLERTPGLAVEPRVPYLARNLRQLGIPPPPTVAAAADIRPAVPKGLKIVSGLQSKICLRSYKLFFCAESEDLLVRTGRSGPEEAVERDLRDKKATRVSRWLDKRRKELEAQPPATNAGASDKLGSATESKAEEVAPAVKGDAAPSEPVAAASADVKPAPVEEDGDKKKQTSAPATNGGDVEMAS